MASEILVPVDGSPLSERALSVALEEHPESTIRLLHVIDPTEPGYSYVSLGVDAYDSPRHGSDEWYDRADAYAAELFEAARETAADYDADLATETRVGRPDREIVRYIEETDVDHVILGSHGRDRESQTLVGGVAEAVVFRSPVRVTLVK
ncbi:universal stress protein [Halohasta salina]|uniref:universal stress protein n=1 Tax=Halohasta salina TaxID=2961621 RepID=UPI0020A46CF4|nr:universal stress protein [Halohasta salina]